MKTSHHFILYSNCIIALFFSINFTFAQSYQFSKYGTEQGMPQQYVYSLNQDNNGFVWIGTGDGIAKFDGIDFQNYTIEDGLAENFISCSGQRQKNIIWLGHNKGGVSRIVDGKISTIVFDTLVGSKITDIIIDQDNYVWATSQNGYLIKISPKLKVEKFDLFFNKKNIYSIAGRADDNILIGTDEGLFLWALDNKLEPSSFIEIKSFNLKTVKCITKSKHLKNHYWIGTASSGLYQLKFGKENTSKSRHFDEIEISDIQGIEEDKEHHLWISTYNGLFKLIYDKTIKGINQTIHFEEANGISNYIKKTLIDREGNVWIGSYGDGLVMLKDEIFTFYTNSDDKTIPNDTRSILFTDSTKWVGLSTGLVKITNDGSLTYYNAQNGFKDVAVTSIISKGDNLFLGTDDEGLFQFNIKTEKFTKIFLVTSFLSNNIHQLIGHINDLWVATEGGLIKKNIITGKTEVFNTLKGLKHNTIYDIMMLKNGSIVVASHSNELTFISKKGKITHQLIANLGQLMDVVDIEVDSENKIWLATLGNGVFKQEADSFVQISSAQGLKSGYCYSIISDRKKGMWVGHRGGLSRISKESLKVEVFDAKKGINLDFNKSAVFIDKEKNIWFGTNKKIVKFNSSKFSQNTTPPIVNIKNVFISGRKHPLEKTIELPYNSYKLKIEFIGISFKQPGGVKYQYFLEGYDLDWSESTSNNFANYPRINDGIYTFYVKACNNDGFCSDETMVFTIVVSTPIWKKWWFFVLIFIACLSIFYAIIKIREKQQLETQKRLETELDKRTIEVVKKSEELEDKNKKITDSINYALRIQKSILPSKQIIKDCFPESFIFYQPRDIVSGDFYWYEKIGNKLIVACADCTGHGVPGAFMSMISSTLFKEIVHLPQITEPDAFLYKLDELLKNTLKQTEKDTIHDGLDLSLCVFDLDTNLLSFSGAYRPVILYRNNKLELIKTTPYSIGGDDFVKKEFKTINIQLKKDDIVYLFTDGFPDQFGGVKGKKLYIKGFKNLIEKSANETMEDQHTIFKDFLKDWMGDFKQVDDVLVMGIKIN